MSDSNQAAISDELTEKELEGVAGGRMKIPGGRYPQARTLGSIAQSDTIDDNDNLPDAGGGVIV